MGLDMLEPQIKSPYTPDLSHLLSKFATKLKEQNWPQDRSAFLAGSCTNSSYEDLSKVTNLVKQAQALGLKLKTPSFVSTGGERFVPQLRRMAYWIP